MVGIAERLQANDGELEIDQVKLKYETLLQDANFLRACERATATDESVKTRQRLAIEAFKSV
jgi:hypothetical protein